MKGREKMINLVYIKNDYFSNNMASSIQVMNTIYALASDGVCVHSFFRRKEVKNAQDVLRYYGLESHENLDMELLYVPSFLSENFLGDIYFTLSAIIFLFRKIKKKKVNVVYCTGVSRYLSLINFVKRIFNFKIVSELHQACLDPGVFKLIKNMFDKRVFDGIITISHALKKEFIRRGINASYIEVAHSGVRPSVKLGLMRRDLMYELGVPFKEDDKIIIYSGHLYVSKGVDILINAFAILQKRIEKACLVILGGTNNSDLHRCRDMVAGLGIDRYVYFSGPVEPSQVKKYLLISDIGVLPTPDSDKNFWRFSSPLKLSEYMEYGLAVVASNLECVSEKIKDGENGILFNPSDKIDLADKIQFVLENNEMRERIGINAKRSAEAFYFTKRAEIISNFLEKIVDRG